MWAVYNMEWIYLNLYALALKYTTESVKFITRCKWAIFVQKDFSLQDKKAFHFSNLHFMCLSACAFFFEWSNETTINTLPVPLLIRHSSLRSSRTSSCVCRTWSWEAVKGAVCYRGGDFSAAHWLCFNCKQKETRTFVTQVIPLNNHTSKPSALVKSIYLISGNVWI